MERKCLQCGFSEEQTDKLMHGHIINYSGWLLDGMPLLIMSRHK